MFERGVEPAHAEIDHDKTIERSHADASPTRSVPLFTGLARGHEKESLQWDVSRRGSLHEKSDEVPSGHGGANDTGDVWSHCVHQEIVARVFLHAHVLDDSSAHGHR